MGTRIKRSAKSKMAQQKASVHLLADSPSPFSMDILATDTPVEGWTGNKCPACKGAGFIGDGNKACHHCGGTGDEYSTRNPTEDTNEVSSS